MYTINRIVIVVIIISVTILSCSSQRPALQITSQDPVPQITPTKNLLVSAWAPFHILIIKSDGTLWGIGDNSCGQLGLGQDSPKRVTALTRIGTDNDWVTVVTALFHTMAIKKNGTLWGWGSNENQQLGFNEVAGGIGPAVPAPKQLGTDTDWKMISCSIADTFAIKTDGTLWIWGYDGSHEITPYDGSTTFGGWLPVKFTLPPTQVGADTDWTELAELLPECSPPPMAIKKDGSLWTWKEDRQYLINQLTGKVMLWKTYWIDVENKTIKNIYRIGNDKWKQITYLGRYIVGLKANGTLWSWDLSPDGTYTSGRLDNNPAQIGTDNDWISISGGSVIKKDNSFWSLFANNKVQPHKITEENNWVGIHGNILLKSDGTFWSRGWNYAKPFEQCALNYYNPAALIPIPDK